MAFINFFFYHWKFLKKLKKLELSPQNSLSGVLHLLYSGIRVGPEYILACKSQKTYLRIGSSGNPSEKFHGVGIGPLSKILAVKSSAFGCISSSLAWFSPTRADSTTKTPAKLPHLHVTDVSIFPCHYYKKVRTSWIISTLTEDMHSLHYLKFLIKNKKYSDRWQTLALVGGLFFF